MAINYKYKKVEDSDKNLRNIQEQTDIWYDDFSESQYFETLSDAEIRKAPFVISTFVEMMFNYCDEFPDEWSEEAMEEVLCELFPSKITTELSYYESVENVLRAFFGFLDLKRFTVPLKRYCRVMIENSKDSSSWGPAKKFAMAAVDSGVDLQDQGAMYKFMEEYNKVQRAKHSKENAKKGVAKIGRNDPCPCGSGIKYKKCCGR